MGCIKMADEWCPDRARRALRKKGYTLGPDEVWNLPDGSDPIADSDVEKKTFAVVARRMGLWVPAVKEVYKDARLEFRRRIGIP